MRGRLVGEHRFSELERGLGGSCIEVGRVSRESRARLRVCKALSSKVHVFGPGTAGTMVTMANVEGQRMVS